DSIETAGALTPFASRSSMGACRLSLANAAHAQTPAQPRTAIITLRFIPSPLPWPRNGRRCASGLRGMDRHSGGNEPASLESGINAIDGTHTPYVVRVRGPSRAASKQVAAAAAAHDVLGPALRTQPRRPASVTAAIGCSYEPIPPRRLDDHVGSHHARLRALVPRACGHLRHGAAPCQRYAKLPGPAVASARGTQVDARGSWCCIRRRHPYRRGPVATGAQ